MDVYAAFCHEGYPVVAMVFKSRFVMVMMVMTWRILGDRLRPLSGNLRKVHT